MPDQHAFDQLMHKQGYRYRLTPTNAAFAPLYAKTLTQIGPLLRDYTETNFEIKPISVPPKDTALTHLWV